MAGAKAAGGLASVGGAVAAALLIAGQLQLLLLYCFHCSLLLP